MASSFTDQMNAHVDRLQALAGLTGRGRASAMDAIRSRNALLDAVFYDIGQVRSSELPLLDFWSTGEGALLLVPPSADGTDLQVFTARPEFLIAGGGKAAALTVAGVGSSAIGSAAFARNVADAVGAPVAAIVSGYGLADVLTEALGGFFWFGALNSLRHNFQQFEKAVEFFSVDRFHPDLEVTRGRLRDRLRLSKDTAILIELLSDPQFGAPLLVGHSKGNLVISEALYALQDAGKIGPVANQCDIITISAKIGMPNAFVGKVFDIMGEWDSFGALNSRPDIPADHIVPRAWHSTNPAFPLDMGIDVTRTLRAVLPLLDTQKTPKRIGPATMMLDWPQRLTGARAPHLD